MQLTARRQYKETPAWPLPKKAPTMQVLPAPVPMPVPASTEDDAAFIKLLHGELVQRLIPAVATALARHASDGGAMLDMQLDRETLAHLVDEILAEAITYSADIEEITLDLDTALWSKCRLLRALVESLAMQHMQLYRQHCPHRNRNMLEIEI